MLMSRFRLVIAAINHYAIMRTNVKTSDMVLDTLELYTNYGGTRIYIYHNTKINKNTLVIFCCLYGKF